MNKVLVLAGTSEARVLISQMGAYDCIASLAGATQTPLDLGVPTRKGGFGGVEGLCGYLKDSNITTIVNATHPFAAQMTQNASTAARLCAIPLLRLTRPAWQPHTDDAWDAVDCISSAAQALPSGARAFVSLGQGGITAFSNRTDTQIYLRSIDPIADLPSHMQGITARPPFSYEDERTLLLDNEISHLVSRNSGGQSGLTKLQAAQDLGVKIIMIARPTILRNTVTAQTPDQALYWLQRASTKASVVKS